MTTLIIIIVILVVVLAAAALVIQRKNREANVARADQLRSQAASTAQVDDRPGPGPRRDGRGGGRGGTCGRRAGRGRGRPGPHRRAAGGGRPRGADPRRRPARPPRRPQGRRLRPAGRRRRRPAAHPSGQGERRARAGRRHRRDRWRERRSCPPHPDPRRCRASRSSRPTAAVAGSPGARTPASRDTPTPVSQVPAASRALRVLRFLATQADPVPLDRIMRACALPRSTAYHLLNTMIDEGFVVHLPDEHRYGLASPPSRWAAGSPGRSRSRGWRGDRWPSWSTGPDTGRTWRCCTAGTSCTSSRSGRRAGRRSSPTSAYACPRTSLHRAGDPGGPARQPGPGALPGPRRVRRPPRQGPGVTQRPAHGAVDRASAVTRPRTAR